MTGRKGNIQNKKKRRIEVGCGQRAECMTKLTPTDEPTTIRVQAWQDTREGNCGQIALACGIAAQNRERTTAILRGKSISVE